MKTRFAHFTAIVLLTLFAASCTSSGDRGTATEPGIHMVKVQEVIPTSVYSYLRVAEEDSEYWIAIRKADVTVGNTYFFKDAHRIEDFESKELGRTFETLYMVDALSDTPLEMQQAPQEQATGKRTPEKQISGSIEHIEGETSIAEIYKAPEAYSGKKITVRGKVVRYNDRIMGRNWVHIQDGTEHGGKFDLTVTTNDVVNVGEVAAFEGTINLNRDFGAGYTYEVIMEDARLTTPTKL
ncbi:MAG: hypothetical protein ACLFPE_03940 [Bacteroidales bacterium]